MSGWGDVLMLAVGGLLILAGGVSFGLTTVAGIGLLYAAFGVEEPPT